MAIVFLRTIIVFAAIVISMRIMGKRQLGELELSELVVAVLISDMASHPLQDIGVPLMNGLIPVITLLCCELLIAGLEMKSVRIRAILCGKPSIIISNGKVVQKEMKKNRLTLDELTEELRNQSISDIGTVKFAILETAGQLNVLLYPSERPVTAAQMNVQTQDTGYPSIIINDGRIMSENLKLLGKNEKWLMNELGRRNAKSPQEVYLMTVDQSGSVHYEAMEARR
jgi:uncharacterized membrane protein YcaP (DUF421 family)